MGEGLPPPPDPTSPSGFSGGQHRLILPAASTDGYHWLLLTERSLAGGGLRLRSTAVDNAPSGREVHWSSPPRWWLMALAWARAQLPPHPPLPLALEDVAAGAAPLALALFLVAITPVVARGLGPWSAAALPLGWVSVFPLYQTSMAGAVDHHGFAAMAGLACLLFLLVGGAGWVSAPEAGSGVKEEGVPRPSTALRCSVLSGVAGGIGVWLSASTTLPLLAAALVGGVLAGGGAARRPAPGAEERRSRRGPALLPPGEGPGTDLWPGSAQPYPDFWRGWGWAGALTSGAAYLLEYFPSHLGLRLEVNHPLYALGWLGAAHLGAWALEKRGGTHPSSALRPLPALPPALALSFLSAPAAVLAVGGARVFSPAEPFLRAFHTEHIREFQGLGRHLEGLSWLGVLQTTSALPLLLFPAALLLLRGASRRRGQAASLGGTAPFVALVVAAGGGGWLWAAAGGGGAALAALGLVGAWLGMGWRQGPTGRVPPPPARALVAASALPAATLLALSLWQVRWLATAAVALVTLASALLAPPIRPVKGPGRLAGAGLAVLILIPFPLSTALLPWRFGYPAREDLPQLVARDAAWWLRAAEGGGELVVAAPPTTTTWLLWFGGFRGVGTLYWENVAGLKATAALFGAETEDTVRRLLEERRVTHVVLPSWETTAAPTKRPAGEEGSWGRPAPSSSSLPYLSRLHQGEAPPPWLEPLPYPAPRLPGSEALRVLVFRVRPAARS